MGFFQSAANLIRKRRVESVALSDALKLQLENRQRRSQFVRSVRGILAQDAILDHVGLPSTGPPLAPARFIARPVEETCDDVPVLQQSLR